LNFRLPVLALVFAASVFAQESSDFGMGWMPEFKAVSKELTSLAEATPADKYAWRPAPGVRSVSEVYVHIAIANKFFMSLSGGKADMSKMKDAEKKITSKDDVLAFLKQSIQEVESNYPNLDMHKKIKFDGADTTVEALMVHCIGHTSEHLGQSIAYARMNGIVPPWSK
jgi:uncharacterized damage-inducible protein DinB